MTARKKSMLVSSARTKMEDAQCTASDESDAISAVTLTRRFMFMAPVAAAAAPAAA